jgi:hypothetical protein
MPKATRRLELLVLILAEVMENVRCGAVYRSFIGSEELMMAVATPRKMRKRVLYSTTTGDHPGYFATMNDVKKIPGPAVPYVARLATCRLPIGDPRHGLRLRYRSSTCTPTC